MEPVGHPVFGIQLPVSPFELAEKACRLPLLSLEPVVLKTWPTIKLDWNLQGINTSITIGIYYLHHLKCA